MLYMVCNLRMSRSKPAPENGFGGHWRPWPSLPAVRMSLSVVLNVGIGKWGVNHNSGSLRNLYRRTDWGSGEDAVSVDKKLPL